MNKIRENIFMSIVILLCILLFGVKLTGGIWHVVFGVMLLVLCVSHTCRHFAKMKYQGKKVRITDEVQMAALAVMFLTGMLLHPTGGLFAVKMLHRLSAVVFVLSMLGHIVQHKAMRREREQGGLKGVTRYAAVKTGNTSEGDLHVS